MTFPTIAVFAEAPEFQQKADVLAKQLQLTTIITDETALLLRIGAEGISLQQNGTERGNPIIVDFNSGEIAHRRKFGGGRGQLIAKAIGLKQGVTPYVIDCTAGLGKDSFVFATLGCIVRMIERSPLIATLLQDGLERSMLAPEIASITARMSLIHGNAIEWLSNLPETNLPDVIYLDPMFPSREKSALVKKEMRLFKHIVGTDDDASALLSVALTKAKYRVVVKRPRIAPQLEGTPPTLSMEGKSSRFDIYALRAMTKL